MQQKSAIKISAGGSHTNRVALIEASRLADKPFCKVPISVCERVAWQSVKALLSPVTLHRMRRLDAGDLFVPRVVADGVKNCVDAFAEAADFARAPRLKNRVAES